MFFVLPREAGNLACAPRYADHYDSCYLHVGRAILPANSPECGDFAHCCCYLLGLLVRQTMVATSVKLAQSPSSVTSFILLSEVSKTIGDLIKLSSDNFGVGGGGEIAKDMIDQLIFAAFYCKRRLGLDRPSSLRKIEIFRAFFFCGVFAHYFARILNNF